MRKCLSEEKKGFGISASGVGKEEPTASSPQPKAKTDKSMMIFHCRLLAVDCRLFEGGGTSEIGL